MTAAPQRAGDGGCWLSATGAPFEIVSVVLRMEDHLFRDVPDK
jgi:hypothetical protein